MQITLHNPPEGYEAEAEVRPPKNGERHYYNGKVCTAICDYEDERIVLTPKRQRAEVRRCWAVVKLSGRRDMFAYLPKRNVYIDHCGEEFNRIALGNTIEWIDGEYLDAQPVPELVADTDKLHSAKVLLARAQLFLGVTGFSSEKAELQRDIKNFLSESVLPAPNTQTKVVSKSEASNG